GGADETRRAVGRHRKPLYLLVSSSPRLLVSSSPDVPHRRDPLVRRRPPARRGGAVVPGRRRGAPVGGADRPLRAPREPGRARREGARGLPRSEAPRRGGRGGGDARARGGPRRVLAEVELPARRRGDAARRVRRLGGGREAAAEGRL